MVLVKKIYSLKTNLFKRMKAVKKKLKMKPKNCIYVICPAAKVSIVASQYEARV